MIDYRGTFVPCLLPRLISGDRCENIVGTLELTDWLIHGRRFLRGFTTLPAEVLQCANKLCLAVCASRHGPRCPTDPFTIPEPQSQEIDTFCVVQERRATDFKAPKL